MNYESLEIQTEEIAQNAVFFSSMSRQTRVKNKRESGIFYRVPWDKKSKYCCHPPFHPPFHPPIFCSHSLKLLSPILPKLITWILLSPPPLSSDPDTPSKFGTCTWVSNLSHVPTNPHPTSPSHIPHSPSLLPSPFLPTSHPFPHPPSSSPPLPFSLPFPHPLTLPPDPLLPFPHFCPPPVSYVPPCFQALQLPTTPYGFLGDLGDHQLLFQ